MFLTQLAGIEDSYIEEMDLIVTATFSALFPTCPSGPLHLFLPGSGSHWTL